MGVNFNDLTTFDPYAPNMGSTKKPMRAIHPDTANRVSDLLTEAARMIAEDLLRHQPPGRDRYKEGYEAGHSEGYEEGYEDGSIEASGEGK